MSLFFFSLLFAIQVWFRPFLFVSVGEDVLVSVRFDFSSVCDACKWTRTHLCAMCILVWISFIFGVQPYQNITILFLYIWCHPQFLLSVIVTNAFRYYFLPLFSFSLTIARLLTFAMRVLLANEIGKLCDCSCIGSNASIAYKLPEFQCHFLMTEFDDMKADGLPFWCKNWRSNWCIITWRS